MLVRFIFLSFCLIAHVSSRFFKNPTQEEGDGRRLQGSSGNKKPLRALRLSEEQPYDEGSSQEQPSDVRPRSLIDRFRSSIKSLFGRRRPKSIDQSGTSAPRTQGYFTDEKRSDAHESWMRNEEKMQLLHQHLQELSAIDSKLEDKKGWLSLAQIEGFEIRGKNAIDGLRELKNRLGYLDQVKLLELGDIDLPNSNSNLMKLVFPNDDHHSMMNPNVDSLPVDAVRDITKKIWKNLGGSIVLDLNNLIVNSHLFFLHSKSCFYSGYVVFLWWKSAFKIIDLLLVMDFVKHDTVREFFRDPNIIENLLHYITLRNTYEITCYDSIMRGSPQFPQQWYWPLWHECFKALSNEEENILRGHLLLQSRYQEVAQLVHMNSQHDSKWKDFFFSRPFDPSQYLQQLRSSSQIPPMIHFDVHRLIELVTSPYTDIGHNMSLRASTITRWLHDILDLIEDCISPGIIKETLVEHPNAWWYEMNRESWKLIYHMDDLSWNADRYLEYVQHQNPHDWWTSSIYESTFDGYVNQLIQTLSEFKKESERVREQSQNQTTQSEHLQMLWTMEQSFDGVVQKLRQFRS